MLLQGAGSGRRFLRVSVAIACKNVRPLAALLLILLAGAAPLAPRVHVASESLPQELSDQAFWQMIADFSEPSGYFRSDNLISNETAFQTVIPDLKKRGVGGVYIGVGPDQNFTYVSALRPGVAFIIDIRRQNMLLHLMDKALIEMSEDRAAFLSLLFSRPRPAELDRDASPQALFEAFDATPASNELFQRNLRLVVDRLVKHHGFALTTEDEESIEDIYRSFYLGGPDLRYSFPQQVGGLWFPTYAELMTGTDRAGLNHAYIASNENFRTLKDLQKRNLIVPLVGDFGGPKTIRRVGDYAREHGSVVTTFYTSNVEQYLFQSDAWRKFLENVATVPIDERSVLIRTYFNLRIPVPRSPSGGIRSRTLVDPIGALIAAFHDGQIRNYEDVINRSTE